MRDVLYAGELEIRPAEGLALATGQALTLSVREFGLLVAMARRIGTILSREELYATVWGRGLRAGDRSVDVYVSKLRTKLEAAMPDRRFIHTHPGFGYRFQPQPVAGGTQGSRGSILAPRKADGQPQPVAGEGQEGWAPSPASPTPETPLSRNFHTTALAD